MKINRSNMTIVILTIIDCFIGYIVISKCLFQKEIENDVKPEGKIEIIENSENIEPIEVEEEPVIVYEGMTIEQLSEKLDRVLTSTLEGTGTIFATKSIELGIDPYLAVAIVLHETGCKWTCSKLVQQCNNVGGMKGSPGCNGGSYRKFDTLEEGITKYMENLYKNYYAYGLTTPETINPKYAASPAWADKVNYYIKYIRQN